MPDRQPGPRTGGLPEGSGSTIEGSERSERQPFTEPWQASVFALTVHLNEEGLFTWPEWADVFGAQLGDPSAATDGSDYYHRWAAALEQILNRRGLADSGSVDELAAAWERAAAATPHGQPIELANDPQRG